MKKLIVLSMCTVMGLASITGCGSKAESSSATESSSSVVELTEFQWPRSDIAALIPQPKSNIGHIEWEASYGFVVYVGNTSKSDYDDYVNACWDAGFTNDYEKGDEWFWGYNDDGYELTVRYDSDEYGDNVMFIRMDEPMELSSSVVESEPEESSSVVSEVISETPEESSVASEADSEGIRPEIKEAIDSYETFMNDYCDFMEKYNESDDTAAMLTEYSDYMKKYADFADKFDKIQDEDLNTEETKYYIDVQTRVSKRLLETSDNLSE